MVAITQRISNLLGGVSQQTDEQKFPGQVRELINGYPDPTFGLLNRPGAKFIAELKDASNNLITPASISSAKLFTIFRDDTEQYLVAIIGGKTPTTNNEIKIWKLSDGSPVTVTYGSNAKNYLSAASRKDYEVLTVNDYTFITNRSVTVAAQGTPSFTASKVATIRLLSVEYSAEYRVKINNSTATVTTRNNDTAGASPTKFLNADDILFDLRAAINNLNISGLTVTQIGTTLELSSSNTFTIDVLGGKGGDGLYAYQNSVENIARLPAKTNHGRVVKVANTNIAQDDYYLKFIGDGNGNGSWEETRAPDVSPGLDAATMPHELVRQNDGTFIFRQVTWEERIVGDLETNPNPSFVGDKITQIFFYNNRLGFLTSENVFMSQAGDYFNCFANSATTTVANDPIDISSSSLKPAVLYAAIPVAQGLVLMSKTQQFILTSDTGVLTPQTVNIKTISNYEMDPDNPPVDMGTTFAFISKMASYTRVFEMETRGSEDSPIVVDISRVVPEWIPNTIDQVVSSPQNSLLSLGITTSKILYMFRFYTNGEKRELQSWFKWQLSGNVLHHSVNEDTMWVATQQANSVVLQRIDLIQSPESSTIQTKAGISVDPRLDMWRLNPTRTFESGTNTTKVYFPYRNDSALKPCVVIGKPITQGSTFLDIGQIVLPTTVSNDNGGDFVTVSGNVTADQVLIGFLYDLDVELPAIYYRTGDNQTFADFTASLVISRLKINTGLSGVWKFYIKAKGRSAWEESFATTDANYYAANDVPLTGSKLFTLPVHQKSANTLLKIRATGPFPVSLISITWEGHYAGKYYNRR